MPACVPSAPGFETPGARIGPKEVAKAMKWKGIIGLGEMMNFPGVFMGDRNMLEEIAVTRAHGKTVGGHYASPDLGLPFHGYAAGGAEDDHEGTRLEDSVARVRQGMKSMLRYGSAWLDVASQVGAITELGLDSRRFMLVTDDSHAQTLSYEGHMDRVLRHAIERGLPPMTAIQMMTINTAEHFGVSKEMGMIAPGRWADVVLAENLNDFKADMVIAKGRVIAENGEWKVSLPKFNYPSWAVNSVHLKKPLKAEDFKLVTRYTSNVKANVIGVVENQAPTKHLTFDMQPENGGIRPDISRDIAKIAVIKRHDGMNGITVGLVSGFGFTGKCAVASTVAHDSHHMIVVGTDETSMAVAGNSLARSGGGQVVVKDAKIIGRVELKIAGLMSTEKADVVARKAETILQGFKACGCMLNNPNMQLSLLALVVIPELRISDKGLVDVTQFKFIPVLEE
jgi:adenine deaminase